MKLLWFNNFILPDDVLFTIPRHLIPMFARVNLRFVRRRPMPRALELWKCKHIGKGKIGLKNSKSQLN